MLLSARLFFRDYAYVLPWSVQATVDSAQPSHLDPIPCRVLCRGVSQSLAMRVRQPVALVTCRSSSRHWPRAGRVGAVLGLLLLHTQCQCRNSRAAHVKWQCTVRPPFLQAGRARPVSRYDKMCLLQLHHCGVSSSGGMIASGRFCRNP